MGAAADGKRGFQPLRPGTTLNRALTAAVEFGAPAELTLWNNAIIDADAIIGDFD
jgi:hypothetical protein